MCEVYWRWFVVMGMGPGGGGVDMMRVGHEDTKDETRADGSCCDLRGGSPWARLAAWQERTERAGSA